MSADIGDAVPAVIVRQIVAVLTAVKGKLQYLHAGEARFGEQGYHAVVNVAEILGDDVYFAERRFYLLKKLNPDALIPSAVDGVLHSARDGVKGRKAPEMVYPQSVAEPERMRRAPYPPAVTVAADMLPVKDGVAPELTL